MVNYRNVTRLIVSSVVLSAGSYDVAFSAEIAPLQKALPNAYGKAELFSEAKTPREKTATTKTGAKYLVGSTFFEKRMELELGLGVHKIDDSAKLNLSEIEVESSFTALNYSDKLIALTPYVKAEIPAQAEQDPTNGRFGAKLSSTYKLPVEAGVFGLTGYYDVGAKFSREPKMVPVTQDGKPLTAVDNPGLGLTADAQGAYQIAPQSLAMQQDVGVAVSYEATKYVPGLSFEVKTRRKIQGTPVMEYTASDKSVAPKTGAMGVQEYAHVGKTSHVFGAKYMITDAVYLKNDFTLYNSKVADASNTEKFAYENMLVVGANLF